MFVGRELSVHSIPVSFSDFSILAVLKMVTEFTFLSRSRQQNCRTDVKIMLDPP